MRMTSLSHPDDPKVIEALGRPCDICHQPAGRYCRNTINPNQPLPGRLVHHGRLIDRTREPKGDQ